MRQRPTRSGALLDEAIRPANFAVARHTDRADDENGRCSGSSHPGQAKVFLFDHAFILGHFHPRRHSMSPKAYRSFGSEVFNSGGRRHASATQHEPHISLLLAGWRPSDVKVTIPPAASHSPASPSR